jgi:hypothetical protein
MRRCRAVCGGCGVRDKCLQEALRHMDPWGIWGGLDPEERNLIFEAGTAVYGGPPKTLGFGGRRAAP